MWEYKAYRSLTQTADLKSPLLDVLAPILRTPILTQCPTLIVYGAWAGQLYLLIFTKLSIFQSLLATSPFGWLMASCSKPQRCPREMLSWLLQRDQYISHWDMTILLRVERKLAECSPLPAKDHFYLMKSKSLLNYRMADICGMRLPSSCCIGRKVLYKAPTTANWRIPKIKVL